MKTAILSPDSTSWRSRKTLRFFFGRLEPIGDWQEQLVAKFRKDFGDSL